MTLRRTSLATTALVLCVSMAYADRETDRPGDRIRFPIVKPGVPGVVAHSFPATVLTGRKFAVPTRVNDPVYESGITFSNLSKDKNAEFVSWYGYNVINTTSSYYVSSHSHAKISEIVYNAALFHGAGTKVKKVGAAIGCDCEVNLSIYSATASGFPGRELAGGSAAANDGGLTWVKLDIFLTKGQEYFLVARCNDENEGSCNGVWYMENTNFTGSEVDYRYAPIIETYDFHYSHTYTYSNSSSWHESTLIPASGAFVIK